MGYPKYYRKEFAGSLARFYDIIFFITSLGLEKGARKKILDFISEEDKRILDLATGTGSSAVIIKDRFDKSEVYGADLSENMLEIARKKNKDIKFSLQNIETTKFHLSWTSDLTAQQEVLGILLCSKTTHYCKWNFECQKPLAVGSTITFMPPISDGWFLTKQILNLILLILLQ